MESIVYTILRHAAGAFCDAIGGTFPIHSIDAFFAGLFSMPIAAGTLITTILTILIAALLVPLSTALGIKSGKTLIIAGAAILFLMITGTNAAFNKLRKNFFYKRRLIIPLHAARDAGLHITGFKGNGLGLLRNLSINTPRGFIISGAVFARWSQHPSVKKHLDQIATSDDPAALIASLIRKRPLPWSFIRKLKRSLKQLGKSKIITRSSFPGEDGSTTSMAGVFDSFYSEPDLASCIATLANVWGSYYSERARAARDGIPPTPAPHHLPVIVQQKIDHSVFFICCSANYLNGRLEEMLISHESRETAGLVVYNMFTKGIRTAAGSETIPFETRTVLRLVDIMQQLEASFDKPVQIEAGLAGNELYIYQVRPLTGFRPVETLTNSFIVDIADFPLTPLSRDLFGLPGTINARLAHRLSPFGLPAGTELLVEKNGRFLLDYNRMRKYINPYYLALPQFAIRSIIPALTDIFAIMTPGRLHKRFKIVDAQFSSLKTSGTASIRTYRDSVLQPLFRLQLDLFEITDSISRKYDAFFDTLFDGNPTIKALSQQLKTAPVDYPWKRMIESLRLLDPENPADVASFITRFGHWGNPEAEVAAPRLADSIAQWLQSAGSAAPAPHRHDIRNKIATEIETALSEHWRYNSFNTGIVLFRLLAGRYQSVMALREEVRDRLNRVMSAIRQTALATGKNDDVFFMTIDEIESGTYQAETIAIRKAAHRQHLDTAPEDYLPDSSPPEIREGKTVVPCLGIGIESAAGKALVTDMPVPAGPERPILIIPKPDGIYGPMLRDISALVIEKGSPLSHLVLLAREAGIPVLIAGSGISKIINSGDPVHADAAKGTLTIG